MNVEKVEGDMQDGVQTDMRNKMSGEIQGEGNYDAAREYDEGATEHARDQQQVTEEADAARDALDGDEAAELERAEAEGRSRARD